MMEIALVCLVPTPLYSKTISQNSLIEPLFIFNFNAISGLDSSVCIAGC